LYALQTCNVRELNTAYRETIDFERDFKFESVRASNMVDRHKTYPAKHFSPKYSSRILKQSKIIENKISAEEPAQRGLTIQETLPIRTPILTPPSSDDSDAPGRRSIDPAICHGNLVAHQSFKNPQAPQ